MNMKAKPRDSDRAELTLVVWPGFSLGAECRELAAFQDFFPFAGGTSATAASAVSSRKVKLSWR
jgi:hypothetical protein